MKRCFVVLMVLFSCATFAAMEQEIDLSRPPPKDWPILKKETHIVTTDVVKKHCPAIWIPKIAACTTVYFQSKLCVTWYVKGWEKDKEVIEHEDKHCQGYDHVGSTQLRDNWNEYKEFRQWKPDAKVP